MENQDIKEFFDKILIDKNEKEIMKKIIDEIDDEKIIEDLLGSIIKQNPKNAK